MDIDPVGGEASSALLLLSRIAADGKDGKESPTSPSQQQLPTRKPVLNVVALIQHIQGLEERVKQLEASSGVRTGSASKIESPTFANGTASVPVSEAASPMVASPRIAGMPSSLTSIRFNNPNAVKSLVASNGDRPEVLQMIRQPPPPMPHILVATPHGLQAQPAHPSAPFGMHHPIHSPPAQSMWPGHPGMVLKDATVKDVQRNVLDRLCNPVLEKCYEPDKTQLMDLVDELEKHHFYHIDRRVLMSAVRRWFRKRREEMGARIFVLCKGSDLIRVEQGGIRDFLRSLKTNTELLDKVRIRVALDVKDEAQGREFVLEKIDSYFRRRIVHSSSP